MRIISSRSPASLAVDPAFIAQYAPTVSIRSSDFVQEGGATAGVYIDTATWGFADAVTQTIAGRIPVGELGSLVGLSPTVRVRWFAPSGSGAVYWRVDMRSSAPGISMATSPTTIIQGASPSSSGLNEMAYDVGVVPITANTDLNLRVYRLGGNVGDTLAASASFIGIDLVRP